MSSYKHDSTTDYTNSTDASHDMTYPTSTLFDESPRCISAINNPKEIAILSYKKEEEEGEETPAEVAALLASIAPIASREIKDNSTMMKELADIAFPDLSHTIDYPAGEELMHWQYCHGSAVMPIKRHHRHYQGEERKKRAVSMDAIEGPNSFEEEAVPTLLQWRSIDSSNSHQYEGKVPVYSTTPQSTVGKHHNAMFGTVPNSEYRLYTSHNNGMPIKKTSIAENVKIKQRPRSISLAEYKGNGHATQKKTHRRHASVGSASDLPYTREGKMDKPMKLISRKKFSWKNYPELEEFLIANREEYLRHSTLNYTMQQKQYNNTLTQRLIELAASHEYQFNPEDFSFTTVRDRIRCYYKSYVQSMKKRGVVIGYAARKAGLVTEEELEASAMTTGKIFVPNHELAWGDDCM